jgi:hypothetical protein
MHLDLIADAATAVRKITQAQLLEARAGLRRPRTRWRPTRSCASFVMHVCRLDAGHCQVLELRFVRDLSYGEIGDALGITSNNAGVRINRALARLKAAFPHLVDGADCLALSAPEARV